VIATSVTSQIAMHFLRIVLEGKEIRLRVMEENSVTGSIWVSGKPEAR
jgi:hypothetical protein